MPRNAGARLKLGCLVAALAALVAACGKDRPIESDGGTSRPKDAGHDAKIEEDAGKDSGVDASGPPWNEPDGGVMLEDKYCVLRVTAECDGREDCDNAPCCARFEPTAVSFTAMECAPPGERCDFQRTFPLCHDGQFCAAENDFTCRTSVLIPGDFIGVCLPPSGFLPSQPPTGKEVAGLIDCGSQQCIVGEEQCCMREGFDTRRVRPLRYEPYCAPIGTPCDCSDVDLPPRDGGMTGDEDAGR